VEDECEVPVSALPGYAAPAMSSEVDGALLQLIGEVSKLSILLQEADSEEVALVRVRLRAFKHLVAELPEAPTRGKQIGFTVGAQKVRSSRRKRNRPV
jgi:hypothetical protein